MNCANLPHIERLPAVDPVDVFGKLSVRPHCLFFDSALKHGTLGRYSYICADPFAFVRVDDPQPGTLNAIEQALGIATKLVPGRSVQERTVCDSISDAPLESLASFKTNRVTGLPPFQGGLAGLLAYDLGRSLERIPATRHDEFAVPSLAMGVYDVVIAFDHQTDEVWLVSQGFSAMSDPADVDERKAIAVRRADQFREWIKDNARGDLSVASSSVDLAGPIFESDRLPGLVSNFSPGDYLDAVQRVVDYICAGDAFQVNLAQRLAFPGSESAPSLYRRLRTRNPATFAGYFDLGDFQIVSASPERFLRVDDRLVETRPIKGTRMRVAMPEANMFAGQELRESEKDIAENVMIVDLMRNDLSRVCEPDSVFVEQLCEVESYEFVQHLVSSVTGRLADGFSPVDLLQASFPGGSITGAPKVRAMEIIAELEPHARGAYCGSLGFIGFDGAMDFSILIRTITVGKGWYQLPVGGGIVAQSDPRSEYEETWHKAEGLLRALVE